LEDFNMVICVIKLIIRFLFCCSTLNLFSIFLH